MQKMSNKDSDWISKLEDPDCMSKAAGQLIARIRQERAAPNETKDAYNERSRKRYKTSISQAYLFRGLLSKLDKPLNKEEKSQCLNVITQRRAIRQLQKLLKQPTTIQPSPTSENNQKPSNS